jgi:hypothetical protein
VQAKNKNKTQTKQLQVKTTASQGNSNSRQSQARQDKKSTRKVQLTRQDKKINKITSQDNHKTRQIMKHRYTPHISLLLSLSPYALNPSMSLTS